MASTSAMRLYPSTAPLTTTRIRDVVTAGKLTVRQTFWLPDTAPPATVSHCPPSQYCTLKEVNPYSENVCVAVGSTGAVKLSCTLKTRTSLMVFAPAKSTCSQSGNPPCVASFQPPPLPQLRPWRSPSIAPVAL